MSQDLPTQGGLIIRKSDKRPGTGNSSLGLQQLAQKKREQEGFKRPTTDISKLPSKSDRYNRHESPRHNDYQKSRSEKPYERPSSNRPKSTSRRSEWDQTPNRTTMGGQTPRDSIRRGTGSWSTVSKRQSSPSNWEMETPKPLFERTEAAFDGENGQDWEDNLKQIDRDWYNLEESGVYIFN